MIFENSVKVGTTHFSISVGVNATKINRKILKTIQQIVKYFINFFFKPQTEICEIYKIQ